MVDPGPMDTFLSRLQIPLPAPAYALARWTLGLVFITAGLTKILDPAAFARVVDAYAILPPVLVELTALTLPPFEVVAGLGLLMDVRGSLTLITAMVLLFLGILGYAILIGLDIDCGCFGPEDPEADLFHNLRTSFVRDIGLLALCLFTYIWRQRRGISPRPLPSLLRRKK